MDERLSALAQTVGSEAEAAAAGTVYESGHYRYVLTADGYAVITGCTGTFAELILPTALDGHEVIAVWKDAFGIGLGSIGIHGNVMYIHPQAFAASVVVSSRSGSYALAWAAQQGMPYQNQTNGELVQGVRDLDDLSDRVTRMSGTLLRVSPATARRFSAGDIAFFTDARGVADVYRVTGMRFAGSFVYLSVETPDISQAVVNMKLEGTVYAKAEDFVAEEGVSITESTDENAQPQIHVRSVFEGGLYITNEPSDFELELSLKPAKLQVTADYSAVEKVQYSIEVINGQLIGGTLVRDSTTVLSLDGKLSGSGEIKKYDKEISALLKKLYNDQKLSDADAKNLAEGVLVLPMGITVTLEAKLAVVGGVYGHVEYATRTIETQKYIDEKWETIDSNEIFRDMNGAPSGFIGVQFKVEATVGMTTVVHFIKTSLVIEFKIAYEFGDENLNGFPCHQVKVSGAVKLIFEAGIWFEVLNQEAGFQVVEAEVVDLPRFEYVWHINNVVHTPEECDYIYKEYHAYFVTGTKWTVEPISYEVLLDFTRTELEVNSLNLVLPFPDQYIGDGEYRWVLIDDQGEMHSWNTRQTYAYNFKRILGKVPQTLNDLPKRMIFYAKWENEVTVTFDPVGGEFKTYSGLPLTAEESLCTQVVPVNGLLREPAVPLKDFNVFCRWYADPSYSGDPWSFDYDVVMEDMTLYAKWEYYGVLSHGDPNATAGLLGSREDLIEASTSLSPEVLITTDGTMISTYNLDRVLQAGCSDEILRQVGAEVYSEDLAELQKYKAKIVYLNYSPVGIHITGFVGEPRQIVIPTSINDLPVSIDSGAFKNCTSLESVYFYPSINIAEFSPSAFAGCTSLVSVHMEDTSIRKIPNYAFDGCTSLKTVTLPKTLTTIGDYAFRECSSLSSLTFGNMLSAVGKQAFTGCHAVTQVTVSSRDVPDKFFADTTIDSEYTLTLSDEVQTLGESAFDGCENMVSLSIGKRLISIGESAFRGCSKFTEVTLPETVRALGEKAFADCGGLKQVSLNDGLERIDRNAFMNCGSLTEMVIPASVSVYQYYPSGTVNIFAGTPLTKLTIGKDDPDGGVGISVLETGMLAELDDTLEELTLRDGVEIIEREAFSNWYYDYSFEKLKKIILPSGLLSIERGGFAGLSALESAQPAQYAGALGLRLPEGLQTIGESAFSRCSALTGVIIPGSVDIISRDAFSNCTNIRTLILKEGIQTIDLRAFKGCEKIDQLTIPESISNYRYSDQTFLENNAFSGAPVTTLTIGGDGVTTISRSMLAEFADTLETLILREGVTTIDQAAFYYPTATSAGVGKYCFTKLKNVVLPSTLTTINGAAFKNLTALESVQPAATACEPGLKLPPNVTYVGKSAFEGCEKLKNAVMSDRLETIDDYAFRGCTGLTSVTLNEKLKALKRGSFQNCPNLTEISIPAGLTTYYSSQRFDEDNIFVGTPIRKLTIGRKQTTEDGISAISRYMLGELDGTLEEVIIRDGVTTIGDSAFYLDFNPYVYQFEKLLSVVLPADLTTIGGSAFAHCTALESIQPAQSAGNAGLLLPGGVTSVSGYAFDGCTSLTQVTLNENLQSIGKRAFADCTGLSEMVIPSTVVTYPVGHLFSETGSYSFRITNVFAGTPIKKLTVGGKGGIETIKEGMFAELDGVLETIIIREGVTAIEKEAFASPYTNKPYCSTKLHTVILPDSLTSVGGYAFHQCTALSSVLCGANLITVPQNAFTATEALRIYGRPTDAEPAFSQAMADCCEAIGVPYLYGEDMNLTVTATFDTGTDSTIPPQRLMPGEKLTAPASPMRPGYVFTGWKEKGAQALWSFETSVMPFEDITLAAQWEKESLNGYYSIENGEATLLSYARVSGESAAVRLPATWQGVPVTRIAAGAFEGEGITRLTLPAGLKAIEDGAFRGMDELEGFYIADDNASFTTADGVLFSKDLTELIHYPKAIPNATYVLGDSVKSIAKDAFSAHPYLTSVTLNEGLLSIGQSAFADCRGLTAFVLPDTLVSIGEDALRNCSSITRVSGGAALESIGSNAFFGTDSMCVFYGEPDGLLTAYAAANKRYCNLYMANLTIDDTPLRTYVLSAGTLLNQPAPYYPADNTIVTHWYLDDTFQEEWDFSTMVMPCSGLTLYGKTQPVYETEAGENGVRITGYNGVQSQIVIPETIHGSCVTEIGSGAFAGTGVTRITLHALLTAIAEDAFSALENVTLLAPAGSYAQDYIGRSGLESETLLYALHFVTSGGAELSDMALAPDAAAMLPTPVRDGCTFNGWYIDEALHVPVVLSDDGLYAMPAANTTLYAAWTVEENVSYDVCWETAERILHDGSMHRYVVVTGANTDAAHIVIPETIHGLAVEEISRMAFSSCSTLRTITLPQSLTVIGDYAFMGSGLREIIIPDTVTSVGTGALRNCRGLSSIVWPSSLSNLPSGVLAGCTSLLRLSLPEGVAVLEEEALMGCANLMNLHLPQTLTTLETHSLSGLTSLTSIALGANVSAVDPQSFMNCTALTGFTVDEENPVFEAPDGVLCFTGDVGVVRYPQARKATTYAIPDGAFLIESYAFAGASHLESISIPDGMNNIGVRAFSGCENLKEIAIPDSVLQIEASAFDNDVTLYGSASSAAASYAQKNSLIFIDPNQTVILPQSLTLNRSDLRMLLGTAFTLSAQITPEEAEGTPIVWHTSDASVVRTDGGYLRATGCGTAVVTAYAGGASATCAVIVTDTPCEVVSPANEVLTGGTLQLSFIDTDTLPIDKVAWSASSGSINEDGLLHAAGAGIISVTCVPQDAASHTIRVLVRDPALEFTLPGALRIIEDEAFASVSLMRAIDLRGAAITGIGSRAFADCANLDYICIPDTVTSIAADAFDGCTNLTICCTEGSAAQAAAKQSGIDCLILHAE